MLFPARVALPRTTTAPVAGALVLLALFAAACGGRGGGAPAATPEPADPVLASAEIGPGGGSLQIADGQHAGVALVVPAGVLAAPTTFRVLLDVANPEVPSIFPVYRFEPADLDFGAAAVEVTVRGGDFYFDDLEVGEVPALALFTRPGTSGAWQAHTQATVDVDGRTVTASTHRLGRFVAWDGFLHRLFTQDVALPDPVADTSTESVLGVDVTIAGGSSTLRIGRGSLQSFWSSPAADNVLVLHGLSGSPLDFLGNDDLVATLSPAVKNIVVASYPSALGVAANANALYNLILAQRQAGFGCNLIAHSMGGLVARYMIEKSAADAARVGRKESDPQLSEMVGTLIMLGTPNGGSALANEIVDALLPIVPEADRRFLQAGFDLREEAESFTAKLNSSYIDNATVYHVIYGDIGDGTDGVVSVTSALAVPLTSPESSWQYDAEHEDLHYACGTLGIAGRINQLLQQL